MRGRQSACCFTGHRPGKLPWRYNEEDLRCVSLKARIAAVRVRLAQIGCGHAPSGSRARLRRSSRTLSITA